MKPVVNDKTNSQNYEALGPLINSHLELLNGDDAKTRQKVIEVCHVGKFLTFFNNEITIDSLQEEPDFILSSKEGKIGLEHQIVVDSEAREIEGFYKNIFLIAESEMKSDPDLPNFFANCYLASNLAYKLKDKPKLIEIVKEVVKEYVLTGNLKENPLIERIWKMPYEEIGFSPNFGGWWQKEITEEIIVEAIKKKEKKISQYRTNTSLPQWLLIVIDSGGSSSYNRAGKLNLSVESEFDKIYILEDFHNKLYEVK